MQNNAVDANYIDQLLARIRHGLIEGVRQEVDRRRQLGIPLYVARNGGVEAIMPKSKASEAPNAIPPTPAEYPFDHHGK